MMSRLGRPRWTYYVPFYFCPFVYKLIEYKIALKNNKAEKHESKWNSLNYESKLLQLSIRHMQAIKTLYKKKFFYVLFDIFINSQCIKNLNDTFLTKGP